LRAANARETALQFAIAAEIAEAIGQRKTIDNNYLLI